MSGAPTDDRPRTVLDYLGLARGFLESKSIENARLDAEVMLAGVLGLSRLELYTSHDRPMVRDEVDRYREMIRRRAAHEPVSYIVGRREFWSLDFAVDRRVLIPRPETETLVDRSLEFLRGLGRDEALAADIGTGSGAIAVALAVERPRLRVVATDRSAASLEVAPLNARTHGVESRIEFVEGDLLEPLAGRGPFDLIVSNPPYVKSKELEASAPEVRDWEPRLALESGEDGMAATRRLIDGAAEHLAADGLLALEVGTQAAEVAAYLGERGWRDTELAKDLSGRARVAVARPPRSVRPTVPEAEGVGHAATSVRAGKGEG